MISMAWYQWFALTSLVICLFFLLVHLVRLVQLGRPRDFSSPNGNVSQGIIYAFTGAMSPAKKESAYLHLPTYATGILYHIGTFLCAGLFLLYLLNIYIPSPYSLILAIILTITGLSGVTILVKRYIKKELRNLSNPDDYVSNILVTLFHFLTASLLYWPIVSPFYFISAGILLLYIPVGKLRHLIYFFAARYQLGFFYGWRGSWPPKKASS
jgi:hypothetical protein